MNKQEETKTRNEMNKRICNNLISKEFKTSSIVLSEVYSMSL